jgi:asparagine synthase (glutamine-hydrolysing)
VKQCQGVPARPAVFRYTENMCGIAGFASVEPLPDNDTILRRIPRDRAPRPDDSCIFRARHAALGHRRLSVIDVADSHQPMPN